MDTNPKETQTVYMIWDVDNECWCPFPFAKRTSAASWAAKRGYNSDKYEVYGFRVRD